MSSIRYREAAELLRAAGYYVEPPAIGKCPHKGDVFTARISTGAPIATGFKSVWFCYTCGQGSQSPAETVE